MNFTLERLVRRNELHLYAGLRRTQVSELIKAGEFPKPIPLSDNGRSVAWLASEVAAWQAQRIAKRQAA